VICASPDYLARQGIPTTPEDLHAHTIISASSVTPNPEWKLMDKGELRSIRLQARMITTTNDSAVRAAVAGFGLTRLLSYQVAEHLRSGYLKTVLVDFEPAALPIHVVHREGRQAPQRVRAFLDMAIERLRQDAALN
jgi:DNA-binding transcriptional LysR family regulator